MPACHGRFLQGTGVKGGTWLQAVFSAQVPQQSGQRPRLAAARGPLRLAALVLTAPLRPARRPEPTAPVLQASEGLLLPV